MPMPSWVPLVWRPTARQRELWWKYVIGEDGTDEKGWWLGWCPLHDANRLPTTATAKFNFRAGSYACLGDPSCHAPKKGMSLSNLEASLITDGGTKARSDG